MRDIIIAIIPSSCFCNSSRWLIDQFLISILKWLKLFDLNTKINYLSFLAAMSLIVISFFVFHLIT